MSTIIDNNIVSMQFDNKNFEKNVKQTLDSIKKLKNALNFDGIEKSLDVVKNGFAVMTAKVSVMETAVTAAIFRMTNSMITYGKNVAKSLSVDQVTAGWEKYAEKTTGVQTIMAATGKSIDEVNDSLEKLNWFTDETSYNFTDMVTNIGKFTSQGIDLDTAVTAMEGISTWAAVSGQGVNEASRAMYNLAQAIGVGSVKLMDWKSIENANMGTKEFKEQAIAAAVAAGTLGTKVSETGETLYYAMDSAGKKMTKTQVTFENFSQTLSEGWFTSDVLISVLKEYGSYADGLYDLSDYVQKGVSKTTSEMIEDLDAITDATTDAEIVQMGYTEQAIEKIRELANTESVVAKKSFKAAQEAKTFAEAIASVKDAVSTGWMTTFEKIFGNYEQAKRLWTDLANDLYEVFAEGGNERNEMLSEWTELEEGGREDLIEGFKDLYEAINNVRIVVKDAFHDIFPKKSANDIAEIVKRFKAFAESIRNNTSSIERFKNGLRGIFSFVKVIKNVVVQITAGIKTAFGGSTKKLLDSTLDVFNSIGDKLQTFSREINRVYKSLGAKPITALVISLSEALKDLYSKLKDVAVIAKDFFKRILNREADSNTNNIANTTNFFVRVIEKLVKGIGALRTKIQQIDIKQYSEIVLKYADKMSNAFDKAHFYFTNFVTALTKETYADVFGDNWEKTGTAAERFGKRLIALGDVLNYHIRQIKTEVNKGVYILDMISSLFSSLAWVITGTMDDSTKSITKFAKTLSEKIDTKLLEWFGDYWIKFSAPFRAAFESISRVLTAIKKAFVDVFGDKTQDDMDSVSTIIKNLVTMFKNFIKSLYVTEERADLLKRTFRGLFSVIDIIKKAFMEYWKVVTGTSVSTGTLIDVILSLTAAIGDWLYALDQTLAKNNTIEKIITGYFNIFREITRIVGELVGVISSFFGAFFGTVEEDGVEPMETFEETIEDAKDVISPFGEALDKAADAILGFGDTLKKLNFEKAKEKAAEFGDRFSKIVDKIKEKFEMVGGFIFGFPSIIKQLFDDIKGKIDEKFPEIKKKFDEIKDKILEIWENIKKAVDPIIDDVKERFNTIGEFLSGLGDNIKSLGSNVKSAVDDINVAFEDFSSIFKKAIDKIKGLFDKEEPINVEIIDDDSKDKAEEDVANKKSIISKIIEALKELYPKTTEAIETHLPQIREFFGKVKDVFTWIGDNVVPKIKELLDDVTLSDLLKFITTGGLALAIKSLSGAVEDIGDLIKSKFSGFAGGSAAYAFTSFAKALLNMALAMGIIAMIPDNKIERATMTVAKLGIAMVTMFGVLTTSSIFMAKNEVNAKLIKSIGWNVIAVSLMMLAIAAALKKIAVIEEEDLRRAVGALVAIISTLLVSFAVLSHNVSNLKETEKAFKDLGSFIKSIGFLAIELAIAAILFKHVEEEDLILLGEALVGFMLGLLGVLWSFKGIGVSKAVVDNFTNALKSMMIAFAVFSLLGLVIQHVDYTAMFSAVAMFAGILAEIIGILVAFKVAKITAPYIKNFTDALTAMMAAFTVFALLGLIIQDIDYKKVLAAVGAFALVLAELTLVLLAFKYFKINTATVTALTIALVGLSGSFLIFAAAVLVLVTSLEKLVALLEEHPVAVQEALELVRNSISIFIEAVMGAVREFLLQIMMAVFDILKYIADNIPVFTELLTNFFMIFIGAAQNVLPEFIKLIRTVIVDILETLITVAPLILKLIGVVLSGILDILVEATPKFMEWLSEIFTGIIKIIDDNINPLIDTVVHLIKAVVDALVEVVPYVAQGFFDFLIAMLDVFAEKIPALVDKLLETITRIIKDTADALIRNAEDLGYAIAYAIGALLVVALKALKGFILGGADIGSQIAEAATELGSTIMEKLFGGIADVISDGKEALSSVTGAISDTFSGAGKAISDFANNAADTLSGWFNGKKNSKEAKKSGYEIGTAIGEGEKEGVEDSLDINSPSVEMSKLGEFSLEGFVKGIKDNLRDISDVGSLMGDGLFGSLSESLSTIQDAIDFDVELNPTVTPVLDLTEFDSGLDEMDEMFEGSNASKVLGVNTNSFVSSGDMSDISSISSLMSTSGIGQNGISESGTSASAGTTINLTQNNYSPEALSRTDIYRQTKNLLSTMQQAWGTVD